MILKYSLWWTTFLGFLGEVYSSICRYTAKGHHQISIDHHFLAVDRVIPEQMKRFEEEVRQHVEEESQKQRYLLNVIYLSVVSYQENGM